jgi:hypothetical protein
VVSGAVAPDASARAIAYGFKGGSLRDMTPVSVQGMDDSPER